MHSPIDIIGGLAFGLIILAFWLGVHNYVDDFIVAGQNGIFRPYFMTPVFAYAMFLESFFFFYAYVFLIILHQFSLFLFRTLRKIVDVAVPH